MHLLYGINSHMFSFKGPQKSDFNASDFVEKILNTSDIAEHALFPVLTRQSTTVNQQLCEVCKHFLHEQITCFSGKQIVHGCLNPTIARVRLLSGVSNFLSSLTVFYSDECGIK